MQWLARRSWEGGDVVRLSITSQLPAKIIEEGVDRATMATITRRRRLYLCGASGALTRQQEGPEKNAHHTSDADQPD